MEAFYFQPHSCPWFWAELSSRSKARRCTSRRPGGYRRHPRTAKCARRHRRCLRATAETRAVRSPKWRVRWVLLEVCRKIRGTRKTHTMCFSYLFVSVVTPYLAWLPHHLYFSWLPIQAGSLLSRLRAFGLRYGPD